MDGAHRRKARVHGDEQIKSLGLADLSDEEAVGAHAQGLLDQAPQADLSDALEVGRPGLHGHAVPVAQGELEDLLAGDDPLRARDRSGQRPDHGGLACLGGARDQDVEAGLHGGVQEGGDLAGQRPHAHEVTGAGGARGVLADVDRPVLGRDGRDDDVKPLSPGELGVDEGAGQVQPAPGGPQHPLDQNSEVLALQDRGGQLGASGAGDEDAAGGVDPDLLNGLVIEVALERSQTRHGVQHVGTRPRRVDKRGDESGVGTTQIVLLGLGDELLEVGGVLEGVDAASAHQLANLRQEKIGSVHDASQRGCCVKG